MKFQKSMGSFSEIYFTVLTFSMTNKILDKKILKVFTRNVVFQEDEKSLLN